MKQPLLYSILKLSLLCLLSSVSQAQKFQGNYVLAKVVNQSEQAVPMTRAKKDQYGFQLTHLTSGEEGSVYSFRYIIGNTIGGKMVVDEADGTIKSVTNLFSTRMMPEEDQYKLEIVMSDVMRSSETIEKKQNRLVLSGSQGSIILKQRAIVK